jgi:diadenylate cyclase
MNERNRAILDGAVLIARRTAADAVLLAAPLPEGAAYLRGQLAGEQRVVAAALNGGAQGAHEHDILALPEVRLRRRGRAKVALLEGLAAGLLRPGERVIIISGSAGEGPFELDTVALVELRHDEELLDGHPEATLGLLSHVADPAVFDSVLGLCVQLGREGREGRRVGLLITLGDHEAVMARSHPIVLNPFEGHPEEARSILNPATRHAVREFSGIDGAFVIRSDGVVVAAGRYLEALAPERELPPGLGARHRAAAGITDATRCAAFVVSQSTGDTRVYVGGQLVVTIERTD